MKIASWNINSLRKRQDRLFVWLDATKPDIVCLQETKCTDEQFPALALQAVGYRSVYHGEKSYNGVAILSKGELLDVRASLCDEVVDPQARLIAATIDSIRVFSIYAPNGQAVGSSAYVYKINWYARLRERFVERRNCQLIVCGDYSTSHRKMRMFTILTFGAARLCVRMANGQRFASCVRPVSATRSDYITKKQVFSVGGIIGCFPFRKIAGYVLTRF
jgi:exodeoxyribonuclease-3